MQRNLCRRAYQCAVNANSVHKPARPPQVHRSLPRYASPLVSVRNASRPHPRTFKAYSVQSTNKRAQATTVPVSTVGGQRSRDGHESKHDERRRRHIPSTVALMFLAGTVLSSVVSADQDDDDYDDVSENDDEMNRSFRVDPETDLSQPDRPSKEFHSPTVAPTAVQSYVMPSSQAKLKVFSCGGNTALATEVAILLGVQLGRINIQRYADGETGVQILDNVRGKDVFVIQPTGHPVNDNLMRLLLTVATLKRASAGRITAIIPYFGYSRQLTNEREGSVSTLAGSDVARLLQTVGVNHVVCVDIHLGQLSGFFESRIPVDNLNTLQAAVPYFKSKHLKEDTVVVGRSTGFFRAKKLSNLLRQHGVETKLGLLYTADSNGYNDADQDHHHTLSSSERVVAPQMQMGMFEDKDVIIVDDMIDSGSRMTAAAEALREAGARRVYALGTHGLFSGNAIETINASEIDEVVVFNTLPTPAGRGSSKIRVLSVSPLIAEAIEKIHTNSSIMSFSKHQ